MKTWIDESHNVWSGVASSKRKSWPSASTAKPEHERIHPAVRYRERSEMLRAMAEKEQNGQHRGTLLKVASVYEHLARAMDDMRGCDADELSYCFGQKDNGLGL